MTWINPLSSSLLACVGLHLLRQDLQLMMLPLLQCLALLGSSLSCLSLAICLGQVDLQCCLLMLALSLLVDTVLFELGLSFRA